MKRKWRIEDIPNLKGKVAIVTGGNKGLGFKSSLELARKGVTVVIGCRNVEQGRNAKKRILNEVSNAAIEVLELDLLDNQKITVFANQFMDSFDRLDILLNNAGVVSLQELTKTKDGKEMHMATNHLGHFVLTGLLLPVIMKTDNARVVTITSGGYKFGEINFDDFDWEQRPYEPVKAYGASKLANMLFMRYLQSKFDELSINAMSVSAQPGLTATERQQSIGMGGWLTKTLATPIEVGCAPFLMAATAEEVEGGSLYGPSFLIWGAPNKNKITGTANDDILAEKLWKYTEELTGLQYQFEL